MVLVPTVVVSGTVQFLVGAAFLSHATADGWLPWVVASASASRSRRMRRRMGVPRM